MGGIVFLETHAGRAARKPPAAGPIAALEWTSRRGTAAPSQAVTPSRDGSPQGTVHPGDLVPEEPVSVPSVN